MPSLRIVYDVDGWAYHNRALILEKYALPDYEVSMVAFHNARDIDEILGDSEPDLFLALDNRSGVEITSELRRRNWQSRVIGTWNNGWPYGSQCCDFNYWIADAIVFNNIGSWKGLGQLPNTCVIENGVDLTTFTVTTPTVNRRPKVVWVGSKFHRTTKRYDNLLLPLRDKLTAKGIDCELLLVDSFGRKRRSPDEMRQWYNQATIYVCASDTEGTPNTALEAAACGCTLVSTRVGNMEALIEDGVNGRLVEGNLESLVRGIEDACSDYPRMAERMQETIATWNWTTRTKQYYDLFEKILNDKKNDKWQADRPDLSKEVTVFVSTVGAQSVKSCLARLEIQSCKFALDIIQEVAPMSRAFQLMLTRCQTQFFVQVDEDMLLHPHAVETLYRRMRDSSPETAVVACPLFDCDLGRRIIGVKIFRRDIAKCYPFKNVEATDVDQNERMKKDGYHIDMPTLPDTEISPLGVLGLHGVYWSDESVYVRYSTLKRKQRRRPGSEAWYLDEELTLFNRFRERPTRHNFFALMGTVSGRLWPLSSAGIEKDWRTYEDYPGFMELEAFFETILKLDDKPGEELTEPQLPEAQYIRRFN